MVIALRRRASVFVAGSLLLLEMHAVRVIHSINGLTPNLIIHLPVQTSI